MTEYIGKSINRLDAVDKVTGQALYNADLSFPHMLIGKVLLSNVPHARIKSINTEKTEKITGVIAVVTGEELPYLGGEAIKDMPFFAKGKVRYHGEPVAAVAAVDYETAAKAVEAIEVEYEMLPAALSVEDALKDRAPVIHPELHNYQHISVVKPVPGTNICNEVTITHGDINEGFARADYIYENTYTSHDVHHSPIEPFSAIAWVERNGLFKVWTTNSSIHRLRKDLSDALKIPQSRIQVMANYIGGSFGGKGGLKVEPLAIALALKTKNRPVKVVFTREETFTSTLIRHASLIKIKTGVTKDGIITARQMELFYDTGAYSEKGPTVMQQACDSACGPYKIPNISVKGYCVYTNKSIAGAYRGYGCFQPAWACESQMDYIAEQLKMDPLEIRYKNALDEGDCNCLGDPVYGVGLKECLKKAAAAIEWDKKAEPSKNNFARAKGIACGWEPTKTPSGSGVTITMNSDGSVNMAMSSAEVGQGSRTALSQITAESLHVPLENVQINFPDTHCTPFDASTTSSRTTYHMGNAIIQASTKIVRELVRQASGLLKTTEVDIILHQGRASSAINPEKSISYKEIITRMYGAGGCILGEDYFYTGSGNAGIYGAPSVYWMYCAHAAEVEIDTETGKITVLKVACAADVGKAINPLNCIQQIEGAVVQGMSNILFEEIIRNNGAVVNPNLHDYKIATATDIPEIIPIIVEYKDPNGPYGAKGVGESAIIPMGAAISNAIAQATGIRFNHSLLKAENMLKEIQTRDVDAW